MSRIVVCGRVNCQYFAKAEHLGDKLAANLPEFTFRKIQIDEADWETQFDAIYAAHNWPKPDTLVSPLIYVELIETGGKALLIGSYKEFAIHSEHYYGITLDYSLPYDDISNANMLQYVKNNSIEPITQLPLISVSIVYGANTHYIYHLMRYLVDGSIFNDSICIDISLIGIGFEDFKQISMEVFDCCSPLISSVNCARDPTCLQYADFIFLDTHEDIFSDAYLTFTNDSLNYLKTNTKPFKCLLTGNHSFTSLVKIAKLFDNTNITNRFQSVSLYFEKIANSVVARKLGLLTCNVSDMFIWGDPWGELGKDFTIIPRISKVSSYDGPIRGPNWFKVDAQSLIYEQNWFSHTFFNEFRILILPNSQPSSLAASVAQHASSWWQPLDGASTYSACIITNNINDNPYLHSTNVPFSYPITYNSSGNLAILDLNLNSEELKELKQISDHLQARIRTMD